MTSAIARSLSRFSCAANSFSASQLTAEQWTALPETLTVRYIKMGYENRSGEKKMLVVVTDLLDATKYPGEELIDLYARRWEIEVKLRDLKPPLGFEFIRAQSPAMARKTLLMTLIAYNLIRALMQSAAAEAGIPVRELSFKGVLDQIISSRDHFKTLYERPAARRKHRSALITLCATKRLNIRPFRHEPRAVKRRPKGYQLLSEPRHTFQEIHHRSEYRKTTQVSAIRLRNFFVCLSGENFALSFESRMPEPLLELKNVTVVRGGRAVLENFSFRFAKGERLAILGRNGSGKSTLLSILTGELHIAFRPESSIQLFGKKRWRLEDLRGQIGFVIPEQTAQFSPRERASDVVLSSFQKAYGVTRMMTFEDDEREATHHAIARAGVAHLADRPFGELSSGEKRRFLLARALVHDPELLVLDEPTTALDLPGAWSYLRTIGELCREGRSLIFVTHDAREIPKEVERVLLLKDGEILADGAKEHILTEPQLSECYGLPVSVTWQDGHCQVQPAAGD